jgi:D-sedoheptulose 7-phosphate isomerase
MEILKLYSENIQSVLSKQDWSQVLTLANAIKKTYLAQRKILLCGNGGSAANAVHFANDLMYGVFKEQDKGIKVNALTSNQSILTCLANDIGYENVFSHQLAVLGDEDDLLIVLSGSGNSPNVVNVLQKAKKIGIKTCSILSYSGGKCLDLSDIPIYFPIDDMQIAEDCQQIVLHMITRWLTDNLSITQ